MEGAVNKAGLATGLASEFAEPVEGRGASPPPGPRPVRRPPITGGLNFVGLGPLLAQSGLNFLNVGFAEGFMATLYLHTTLAERNKKAAKALVSSKGQASASFQAAVVSAEL